MAKNKQSVEILAAGVRRGERRALARAITLVESNRADHRRQADELLSLLMAQPDVETGGQTQTDAAPSLRPSSLRPPSLRIGVSGAPGVGKSTFIEALGVEIVRQGHRLAVLAVDPSSSLAGGSILGDKTRMQNLMRLDEACIRPSPTGTTIAGANLGGVATRSHETMLLCEAAGFDVVLVETVGVGQSETRVADMTDMFILLLSPGGGDELQGVKRGIVELADLLLINKADGERLPQAEQTTADYGAALKLLRPRHKNWRPLALTCSALQKTGVEEVWRTIKAFQQAMLSGGALTERRKRQSRGWMWNEVSEQLLNRFHQDEAVRQMAERLEREVISGKLPASKAAACCLTPFWPLKSNRNKSKSRKSKESTPRGGGFGLTPKEPVVNHAVCW